MGRHPARAPGAGAVGAGPRPAGGAVRRDHHREEHGERSGAFGSGWTRRPGTRSGVGAMTEAVDVLEALLFASDSPLEAARIQEVLDLPAAAAQELVDALRRRLDEEGRPLQLIEAGGGFRL